MLKQISALRILSWEELTDLVKNIDDQLTTQTITPKDKVSVIPSHMMQDRISENGLKFGITNAKDVDVCLFKLEYENEVSQMMTNEDVIYAEIIEIPLDNEAPRIKFPWDRS